MRARRNKLIADFEAEMAAKGDAGVAEAIAIVDSAVAAHIKKLEGKQAALAIEKANQPEKCDTRTAEALETKAEETKLKLGQGVLTKERVAVVKDVLSKGFDAVFATLSADAQAQLAIPASAAGAAPALIKAITGLEAGGTLSADAKKVASKLSSLVGAANNVVFNGKLNAVVNCARDQLGERLDQEKGGSVSDHAIFNAHSRKWEKEYLYDMELLNVKAPDVMTRVTENIPCIVSFVDKIVQKGLAYVSNGSVYLSIDEFKKAGHSYRKLKPGKDTTADEMAESEGDLGGEGSEKKHPNDFALWKASKPGEPDWESPWGRGRPGWHIECSAIAGDVLGDHLDIHAGGIDLKFPHHDNELAQSEAHYGHHQWVSYFLHAGHLHIDGLKMSKSLKNFVTIRQALAEHTLPDGRKYRTTARQIRLMFLLQKWDRPMTYSDSAVDESKTKERTFKNFFGAVKAHMRKDWLKGDVGFTATDRALTKILDDTQAAVHASICNNFYTKGAIEALEKLVAEINKFLSDPEASPSQYLVQKAAVYVTKILRCFGIVEGAEDIGFSIPNVSENKESIVAPFIDQIVTFRESVRAVARGTAAADEMSACVAAQDAKMKLLGVTVTAASAWTAKDTALAASAGSFIDVFVAFRAAILELAGKGAPTKEYLQACDDLRDGSCVAAGIKVGDAQKEGDSATWMLDDPASLQAEIDDKKAEQKAKALTKVKNKLEKEEKKLATANATLIPATELFASDKDAGKAKFGAELDAKGIPAKMANGDDLSKKLAKDCAKRLGAHGKALAKLEKQAKGDVAAYVAGIEAEIAKLKAQLA